jgi:radical SAM superfamily enzyme YgiQ (UPF0313 family)
MRAPGDVLLVSCYELGHQPLGTALPAAFLARAGYAPAQVDLAVEPLPEERVARARFVGIAVPMHTALRLGVQAARRARRLNPGAFICCYGLYAHLNRDFLLAGIADAVLAGECEDALVALVGRLERGERPAPPHPAAPVLARLDFPVPLRPPVPAGAAPYARLQRESGQVPAGYVEASRGCLHHCLHCPIPPVYGGRFFVIPREVVMEDIRRQVAAGARHITFGDPDFLNGPGHALALARALHAEFPDVTYDVTAKVEHLLRHRALLPELAATGCAFLVSAVESLSDTVLTRLEKGHTRADVMEALRLTRAAGIPLRPSLLPFTPWATLEDYFALLDFIGAEGLVDQVDPVQLTIRLLVPPGSALLTKPWMREHLGRLDAEGLTWTWTHPDSRMDRLQVVVSGLVEEATAAHSDPVEILEQIRVAAMTVRDRRPPLHRRPPPIAPRIRSPRLTEPWFC